MVIIYINNALPLLRRVPLPPHHLLLGQVSLVIVHPWPSLRIFYSYNYRGKYFWTALCLCWSSSVSQVVLLLEGVRERIWVTHTFSTPKAMAYLLKSPVVATLRLQRCLQASFLSYVRIKFLGHWADLFFCERMIFFGGFVVLGQGYVRIRVFSRIKR